MEMELGSLYCHTLGISYLLLREPLRGAELLVIIWLVATLAVILRKPISLVWLELSDHCTCLGKFQMLRQAYS